MSTALDSQKILVINIGKAWTKAFLVDTSDQKISISKKLTLPTSVGDLAFVYGKVIEKLGGKDIEVLLTSSLPEGENVAKASGNKFVSHDQARESLTSYLDTHGFKKPVILDAGDYLFSPNTKINELGAFLTSEISEIDIENYFGNKSLHPRSVPVDQTDLELEEAFLRVSFASNQQFMNASALTNAVVTGSFFSLSPAITKLGLVISDILSEGRVAQVKLDKDLFAHSFGALIASNPNLADFESDFLVDLGAFISLGGSGKVMLDYGLTEKQEILINEDEIAVIPAKDGQEVQVTFLDNEKFKLTLRGGLFGLMLDGREKPLRLVFGKAESREAVKKWTSAIEKLEIL